MSYLPLIGLKMASAHIGSKVRIKVIEGDEFSGFVHSVDANTGKLTLDKGTAWCFTKFVGFILYNNTLFVVRSTDHWTDWSDSLIFTI